MIKKTVRVVAAVIRDGDGIFATQRGYGDYKDGWEFPGGKIEPGETPQEALARELKEELDITTKWCLTPLRNRYNNYIVLTHSKPVNINVCRLLPYLIFDFLVQYSRNFRHF